MPTALLPQRESTTIRACKGPHTTLSSHPLPYPQLESSCRNPYSSTCADTQTSPVWQPQHTAQLCTPGHMAMPIMTSSVFPSTESFSHSHTADTNTDSKLSHKPHRHVPSQSGNKPANTGYALHPTRLTACSSKASLGLPCSSSCMFSDPGTMQPYIHARVC